MRSCSLCILSLVITCLAGTNHFCIKGRVTHLSTCVLVPVTRPMRSGWTHTYSYSTRFRLPACWAKQLRARNFSPNRLVRFRLTANSRSALSPSTLLDRTTTDRESLTHSDRALRLAFLFLVSYLAESNKYGPRFPNEPG